MVNLWTQVLLIFLLAAVGIVSAEHYDITLEANSSLPSEILQPYSLVGRTTGGGTCAQGQPCPDGSCCNGDRYPHPDLGNVEEADPDIVFQWICTKLFPTSIMYC
jgi:hypothetical protein